MLRSENRVLVFTGIIQLDLSTFISIYPYSVPLEAVVVFLFFSSVKRETLTYPSFSQMFSVLIPFNLTNAPASVKRCAGATFDP